MGLLNSSLKIESLKADAAELFIIRYPRKNGKVVLLGKDILCNILKSNIVTVDVDTSLSFLNTKKVSKFTRELKNLLQKNDIRFDYRVLESNSSGGGISQLFKFNKKQKDREIITFKLPQHFNNSDLFDIMLGIGCEIFVAIEFNDDIVQEIFNCHFQDQEVRYSTFKYVLFLNNYLDQAALRTKLLNLRDVQKLCEFNSQN